jgi:hypothetical protein
MTQQHPITPPPELLQRLYGLPQMRAIEAAFQSGADQELEACIAWFDKCIRGYELVADRLRAARRPKSPSLKEQALTVLDDASDRLDAAHENIIRRALEQLPDHG